MSSLGHRLRIFDVLATLPPSTSVQIADAAGLNERYVREWLGGLSAAGIVRYTPSDESYQLRAEYIPLLSGGGPANVARNIQLIASMGEVTPKLLEVFRTGGCSVRPSWTAARPASVRAKHSNAGSI